MTQKHQGTKSSRRILSVTLSLWALEAKMQFDTLPKWNTQSP